jgi:hypothetical protein
MSASAPDEQRKDIGLQGVTSIDISSLPGIALHVPYAWRVLEQHL